MTAEIAIVNRSALALAADSAVTIRIGNHVKIYDSAEKILEFSRTQPLALMLYNNVEFVNVPLDVLVRKFRNENKKEYQRVTDAANDFLSFLRKFPRDAEDEKNHLFQVLYPRYKSFSRQHITIAQETIKSIVSGKTPTSDLKQEFLGFLQNEIEKEVANALPKFMENRTLKEFSNRYKDIVDFAAEKAAPEAFKDDDIRAKLLEYAFALAKSKTKSPVFTGIVLGGFAKKDLFPTLSYCEIDGVYFDELKFVEGTIKDIDRRGESAAIVPFAQQEMAQRFIFGVDVKWERNVRKFVEETVTAIIDAKPGAFANAEQSSIRSEVLGKFENMMGELKNASENSVLDIVNFMSKKELAEMAHALVELTSKKRRFSAESETVGGPIDVAIITRNEGLVWIARKHYFDPKLNPNFVERVHQSMNQGGRNVGASKATKPKSRGRPAAAKRSS